MKISHSYKLFAITITLLLIIIGIVVFKALTVQDDVTRSEQHRFRSFLLAMELFQSSENMTRMARSYVTTGNPIYENRYFEILDIRNGKKPRPEHYTVTYWHLSGVGRGPAIAPGEAVALQDLMRREGFTEQEFALLRQSQANSDKLATMEKQAFAALKGLYDDGHGNLTVRGAPNRGYAARLLFSEKYFDEKARIMAPIQEFMDGIDERIQAELSALQSKLRRYILAALVFIVMTLLTVAAKIIHVFRSILKPIEYLSSRVADIAQGNYAVRCDIRSSDEIGELCAHFNSMADFIETDIRQRRVTEEALQESEQQVRLLFNSTAEAIYGIDLRGNCTFANPSCLRMLGYIDMGQLLGKNMHSLIHHSRPDGSPMPVEVCRIYQAFREGTGVHVDDEVFWRADGTCFPAEYWSYPQIVNGKVSGAAVTFINITERKQAEEALRESRQQFQGLVETLYDWVWEVDTQGRYTYISPQIKNILGYEPGEILGKTPFDLMSPEEAKRVSEIFGALIAERKPIAALENINLHKDGHPVILETNGLPFYDADGNFQGYRGTDRDITERKKAEEEIKQSEEKLKEAQRIARMGNWELDLTKNILFWSDGIYELFEIDPREFGASYDAFLNTIHPDDREEVGRAYAESLKNRTPYEISHRLLMKDGRIKWVNEGCRTEYDIQGNPLKSFGIVQDITERKQTEETLKETSEYLNNLIEYANAPIIVWDAKLRITRFNQAFERITGKSAEDVLGKHIELLFPEETKTPTLEHIRKTVAGEKWETVEIPIKHVDGTIRTLLWNSANIYRTDGKALVSTVAQGQDITERKRTEEKIRHMATHDGLTDLPSLKLAKDRLAMAMGMARRKKTAAAVMFTDLDGFKAINDTYGHDVGDEVLREVANRFCSCVRETDTVARVGGDEFLMVITELQSPENAAKIAEKMIRLVSQPIMIKGRQASVGASIGIALFPRDGDNIDRLIKLADEAMYSIKNSGKNGYRFASTAT
ncbi:MAG: PAS domain S-box protein [Deltaproteobacteria bacterium]|nr:PAS domain S-box protein [Deltaproteobacteria bacterium]